MDQTNLRRVNRILVGVTTLTIATFAASCGSDDETSISSTVSQLFPSGLALSSPTAARTSTAIVLKDRVQMAGTAPTAVAADGDFSAKKKELDTVLEAASAEACQVTLPTSSNQGDPSCYGPQLYYQNHPDGSPTSGNLPGGDLGIWTSSDSSGTACAAAKMNQLITNAASRVDAVLKTSASMACLVKVNSLTLPEAGGSLDLTSQVSSALSSKNAGLTISAASIAREADSEGRAVYLYTITMTANGSTNTLYMRHRSGDDTGSTYKGTTWGTSLNGSTGYGFMLRYEKTSSALKYQLRGASYNGGTNLAAAHNSSTGELKVNSTWSGNMSEAVFNLNPTTGDGNVWYSWQAGSGDDSTRVFNVTVSGTTGCGFFGYGSAFNTSTGASVDGTISKFICNWAGPGNSHSGSPGKAQKQCMNLTNNKWVVDSTKDKIAYAPSVACVKGGGSFNLSTDNTTYTAAPSSSDLVTLSSDTDFASYSAPSLPSTL